MQSTFKPHLLLFVTALAFLAVSFVPIKKTLDLHIYDTYFVVSSPFLYISFAAFLVLNGLFYLTTNRIFYATQLTRLHAVLTVVILIVLAVLLNIHTSLPSVHSASSLDTGRMTLAYGTSQYMGILFLLLLATQLLFLINLVWGLFKNMYTGRQV